MVRVKTALKLIEGEKHRNGTFMKRRVVIKKKTMELGKLCDIATLLVCYGPRGQLETWPEEPLEARRIIHHYRSLRAQEGVTRRYDVATFFDAHLKKLQADLDRKRTSWLDGLPVGCLEPLARALDAKLAAIDELLGAHAGADHVEEEGRRGKEIIIEQVCRWGAAPAPETNNYAAAGLGGSGLYAAAPFNGGLPAPSNAILDVQPIQSLGDHLPWKVLKTEKFNSNKGTLQGRRAAAAAAAAACKAPQYCQLQRPGTGRTAAPLTIGNPPVPEPYQLVCNGGLPLSTKLEVQPVQISEGLDLSRVDVVMLEELRRGKGTTLIRGRSTAAAGWEAPGHDLQRSVEMPHATADLFMPPPAIPEQDFSTADVGYLDYDPFFSGPFLCMDFAAGAGASTSSAFDLPNPTTTTTAAFPLLNGNAACGGGPLRDWNNMSASFDLQPAVLDNAGSQYGLPLCHILSTRDQTVAASNQQMYDHLNHELYFGADQFFHGGRHTTTAAAGTSTLKAETTSTIWPSSVLQDLPPAAGCSYTGDSVRAAALLSRDGYLQFMPTPRAKNPYE